MADPGALSAAMDRLWAQFRPQMTERVDVLEAAARAAAADMLTKELRRSAETEAHKLAGVLGTFGLSLGTELAREAEAVFASGVDAAVAAAPRLAEIAAQLQGILAAKA
ncbi:MAG TPA: Hpt domain-containing protein [Terracidiphilus sp.]|nr:Hpt domain-containing protein [Terracidiphilus sp.]